MPHLPQIVFFARCHTTFQSKNLLDCKQLQNPKRDSSCPPQDYCCHHQYQDHHDAVLDQLTIKELITACLTCHIMTQAERQISQGVGQAQHPCHSCAKIHDLASCLEVASAEPPRSLVSHIRSQTSQRHSRPQASGQGHLSGQ